MPIRFHLDENVDHAVAVGLRHRGIEVTTSTDGGLIGATDEQQLAFARGQGRVLLTHDTDFLVLHAGGAEHAGIAFCAKNTRSVGEIIRQLCLIHDLLTPEEMLHRIEFLYY
jgi:predicted nuclease of predicted toxin-antitoxin system